MTQHNLKKALHQHINKKSLTEDQLDTLLKIQQGSAVRSSWQKLVAFRWAATAASLLLVLFASFYIQQSPLIDLDQRIGSEVAKNHIKLKPLEIQTSSIQDIRNYFTELDFSPIESSLIQKANKTLVGGRYCSIQGITAAQLRLKDKKTGQVQSLYQTLYKKDIFTGLPQLEEGKKPITVYAKGLEVDIWVEKGVLFALTREIAEQGKQN